jgi:hypothetical protein
MDQLDNVIGAIEDGITIFTERILIHQYRRKNENQDLVAKIAMLL